MMDQQEKRKKRKDDTTERDITESRTNVKKKNLYPITKKKNVPQE